ncbi:hypothetical protein CNECB9_3760018 [Cupriavidus necator]|uniref:Uncharacterized protein n=1 Tax=Cupriavidus necator TaxID=106590 RepID=A0A1K0IVZ9_CUPNE|nr:hypothetical protein CNECB9_3760018 [Cupriavidus necator]
MKTGERIFHNLGGGPFDLPRAASLKIKRAHHVHQRDTLSLRASTVSSGCPCARSRLANVRRPEWLL